jgi:predicted NAD/FAD-binding protein
VNSQAAELLSAPIIANRTILNIIFLQSNDIRTIPRRNGAWVGWSMDATLNPSGRNVAFWKMTVARARPGG